MIKKVTFTVEESDSGLKVGVESEGFRPFELLGILEVLKQDRLRSMMGETTPCDEEE